MNPESQFPTARRADAKGLNWYAPQLELSHIVLVDECTVAKTEALISGCERCNEAAEISFDYLLDAVSGCDPSNTEYLMCRPARCPSCHGAVCEKTLIIAD